MSREDKKFLGDSSGRNQKSESAKNFIDPEEAKTVLDHKDTVIKNLEDENRLLRTLATTGIVTNTYVHEIKDITHKLSMKIVLAKEALELDSNLQDVLKYLNEANVMRESLFYIWNYLYSLGDSCHLYSISYFRIRNIYRENVTYSRCTWSSYCKWLLFEKE